MTESNETNRIVVGRGFLDGGWAAATPRGPRRRSRYRAPVVNGLTALAVLLGMLGAAAGAGANAAENAPRKVKSVAAWAGTFTRRFEMIEPVPYSVWHDNLVSWERTTAHITPSGGVLVDASAYGDGVYWMDCGDGRTEELTVISETDPVEDYLAHTAGTFLLQVDFYDDGTYRFSNIAPGRGELESSFAAPYSGQWTYSAACSSPAEVVPTGGPGSFFGGIFFDLPGMYSCPNQPSMYNDQLGGTGDPSSTVLSGEWTCEWTPEGGPKISDRVAWDLTWVPVANDNRPPVALDDAAEALGTALLPLDVLANDTDPDGDPLRVAVVEQPAHGEARIAAGDAGVDYNADPGFAGTDRFTYTVSDGRGGADTATVTVTVGGDADGDGIADGEDNCWEVWNPEQRGAKRNDADGDGKGIACDRDEAERIPRIYVVNGITDQNLESGKEPTDGKGYLGWHTEADGKRKGGLEALLEDFGYPEHDARNTAIVYDDPFDPPGPNNALVEKATDVADVIDETNWLGSGSCEAASGARFSARTCTFIRSDLAAYPLAAGQEILLVGHSGGGAIAANVAKMLDGQLAWRPTADGRVDEPIRLRGVATLGSPMVHWTHIPDDLPTLAVQHRYDRFGDPGGNFGIPRTLLPSGGAPGWIGQPDREVSIGKEIKQAKKGKKSKKGKTGKKKKGKAGRPWSFTAAHSSYYQDDPNGWQTSRILAGTFFPNLPDWEGGVQFAAQARVASTEARPEPNAGVKVEVGEEAEAMAAPEASARPPDTSEDATSDDPKRTADPEPTSAKAGEDERTQPDERADKQPKQRSKRSKQRAGQDNQQGEQAGKRGRSGGDDGHHASKKARSARDGKDRREDSR